MRDRSKRIVGCFVLMLVLALVLGSSAAVGQTVLGCAMCLSLPPHQRVSEFGADAGVAYVWTLLSDLDGEHTVRWDWTGPSGHVRKTNGPLTIGLRGARYPVYPITQSLALTDPAVRSRPGTWRVSVYLDDVLLVTESFDIVSVTNVGDYGDAPDGGLCGYASDPSLDVLGRFPTRYDTVNSRVPGEPGAHAMIGGEEAIGDPRLTSLEKGAADTEDPDGTPNLIDDDIDDGLSITLLSNGSLGFSIRISVAAEAPSRIRYLNAVYDMNRDGEWRNTPTAVEWIVKNLVIDLEPGESQDMAILLPMDSDWITSISEPRWLRLVLSDSVVSEGLHASTGGWDGSGRFTRGEVEDYKIGFASVQDVAWAAQRASRVSSATARAHVVSLTWSFSQAVAKVNAIAVAHAEALAYVQAAATAKAQAAAHAQAAADAYASAAAEADAFALASASTPCANVTAWASASVAAILQASASARASAASAAAAAADAHAQALAHADALAVAYADAQASAASFALAIAEAYAIADAYAASGASAGAWASAWAQSAGTDALATAYALAWVQARAWATTSISVLASASTWATAVSHAEAIARAAALADATALALARASASAAAWAAAAAEARAVASASVLAMTHAAAGASVTVLENCCAGLSAPCDCDSCCVPCPACNSCCAACPACNSCCAACPACDSCCDQPAGGQSGGQTGGSQDCRNEWPDLSDDVQDAIVRLAYVTGQDSAYCHESRKRYRSKADVKDDVDLWAVWTKGDRQIRTDARDLQYSVIRSTGTAATQVVALWQQIYDLGYYGRPLSPCFSHLEIPNWGWDCGCGG